MDPEHTANIGNREQAVHPVSRLRVASLHFQVVVEKKLKIVLAWHQLLLEEIPSIWDKDSVKRGRDIMRYRCGKSCAPFKRRSET